MQKNAGDSTRSRIQVLVSTKRCKIDVPVMQLEFEIPHRVGKVPAYRTALCMRCGGDELDWESLAGVELNARKENYGDAGAFACVRSTLSALS